jgi:pimeloyl-ACP methyl ester carboxylesterase
MKAPVTVAFGSRDLLLLRHQSRHLDELPPTTRTALLHGCGHVPMGDNPDAVVDVIKNATNRSRTATSKPRASRGDFDLLGQEAPLAA